MVSTLVNDDKPSNEEGQNRSESSGPGTSERVFLAMQTSRVNTLEVVLRTTRRMFLPEGHPLLNLMDRSFSIFGIQGVVSALSDGPSLYHLELCVPMETLEGDTLVSSLMSNHADSPILEGVSSPMDLPRA